MTRLIRRSVLGLTILFVLGVGTYVFFTERRLVVPVVSAEHDVPVRVYGLGTVEARIVSKVGFEVGAALSSLIVDSGDLISEGQVLARLRSTEQQARVARAEAALVATGTVLGKTKASVVRARAVLVQRKEANARKQALIGRGTISTQSAEEAQRDVEVAAAELAVAECEVDIAHAQIADAKAGLRYESVLLENRVLRATERATGQHLGIARPRFAIPAFIVASPKGRRQPLEVRTVNRTKRQSFLRDRAPPASVMLP